MNWQHFQTYNEAPTRAFEALCNQLFELWIKREYKEDVNSFVVVNGAGGDGGIEAYATLINGDEIGVQAKWFIDSLSSSKFNQIKKSILTAMEVHSQIKKYIVCIPRDLSNTKKGKNGEIIKENEYSRWQQLEEDVAKKFPQLVIDLWGDAKIEEQLQFAESAGVRRYWFEKEELAIEQIKQSFERQKNGWLRQRYISVLHNQGTIHNEMKKFAGEIEICKANLYKLRYIKREYEHFIEHSKRLIDLLGQQNKISEELGIFNKLCNCVQNQLKQINEMERKFVYGIQIGEWKDYITDFNKINCIKRWLDENAHREEFHHFYDVEKALDKILNVDINNLYQSIRQGTDFDELLIIGQRGTGKTHGVVNEIETQLSKNHHVPVLIQARIFAERDTWKKILVDVLGLSESWSEEEIWSALEAISYRHEINSPFDIENGDSIRIVPKVIIYIDGIDEMKPYSRWNERISEASVIIKNHPRLRFCFTGREYAFTDRALLNGSNYKKIHLSDDGDVPVRTIFLSYIDYYKVNISGAEWLKDALKTPYSLKLFCELYKGKTVGKIEKSNITVTKLLEHKIFDLNEEFGRTYGFEVYKHENIVKEALIKLHLIFNENTELSREQIKELLRDTNIYRVLSEGGLIQILDFFEKQAFLQSYKKRANSFFEQEQIIYSLGNQPTYDYLKALYQYEKEKYTKESDIGDELLYWLGAVQMYAIMILENYGELIWYNEACRKYFSAQELFEISAYALISVSPDVSEKYEYWVREIMEKNAGALAEVVNNIVLPLARYKDHALGSRLLDEYLRSFDKPAERDVVWSMPVGLKGDKGSKWVTYTEVNYQDEAYRLEESDYYDGLPLVYAWGLTTVCNERRVFLRKEIIRWAVLRPEEFYKLFVQMVINNDEQLRTDIFAIAMSVCHVCRKNKLFLKKISCWVGKNIFQISKIDGVRNAAIRYYARAIMECAFSEDVITEKQIKKCRPPYISGNSLLSFSIEATAGSRMGGYRMMDYDLARYVLCDPIDRMFFSDRRRENKDDVDGMLKKYKHKYKLPELTTEKFILGSAYGYILFTGWNDNIFYGRPNGGKPKEKLGLDIAINRKFGQATHGAMSKVMTVTEKYTWCAKMELLGYLSDRVQFYDYEEGYYWIKDYGMMEDFVNPYQELCQIDVDKEMENAEWYMPETLNPHVPECGYDKEGIKKWVNYAPKPNFSSWINLTENETTLYAFHSMDDDEKGVSTMLWISSCLVERNKISQLVKALANSDFAHELINPEDIHAYPDADCYVSPLEICWFDWKYEHGSEIEFGKSRLKKNVIRCICDSQEFGEIYYKMPSRNIRNILGITSGDGYRFTDSNGVEMARYINVGEKWGNTQSVLLADKDKLDEYLIQNNMQLIWMVRVLREVSNKARENFDDFFIDNDKSYLIWKNSRGWQERKIIFDK